MTDHSHTALIIIDNQDGFFTNTKYWGTERNNSSYEENMRTLVSAFRSSPTKSTAPHIIHVYHSSSHPTSPLHPSSPGMKIHSSSFPQDGEPVFYKTVNSAFVKNDVRNYLKEKEIWKIYFAGLTTDHCVSTSIRMGSNMGVADHIDGEGKVVKGDIVLVEDAVATWAKGRFDAETVHAVNVESLRDEFARVVTLDEALKEINA
jgi:nicotinamidase-related amidase